jgi:hypothetical protein
MERSHAWVDLSLARQEICVSVTARSNSDDVLTVQEAGRWLGVARSTMYELMRKGLPYV